MKFKSVVCVAIVALFAAAVRGQACYAENDGNTYNPAISMGGPNLIVGIKFTVPFSMTVSAAEVFTGNCSGPNTLAIWSHNPSGNLPGVSLGSGSWTMTSAPSWQGTSLSSPVALAGGTTYWLAWGVQNGSQASIDVASSTSIAQQYRASFNAGSTWSGPFMFNDRVWKFRLSCGGPQWQVNQACASLDVNGVQSNGMAPAITTVPANQTATVNLGGLTGAPWDIIFTVNTPLLPAGLVTAGGQIVNLDLNAAGFIFGAGFQNAFFPGSLGATFSAPGTQVAAQMVLVTPTMPDGFCLSQAAELQIL